MNNRLLAIVLMVFALLLSALVVRDGNILLLTLPFLAYLGVAVARAPRALDLAAVRRLSRATAVAGQPVACRLTLHNQGQLADIYIEDALSPHVKILSGSPLHRSLLSPGETATLEYVFQAPRGAYSWSSLRLRTGDPFGLFDLEQDVPAPAETLVLPDSLRLRRIPLRPRFTIHAAGSIPARLAGSGTDFWGVREYRPGDSLQRLNWRLSVRHPRRRFTNEFEQEEIADFGLVLDAREMGLSGQDGSLFEHSVRAVSSLSELFLKEGNRVGLLVYGQSLTALVPGYGKRQLHRILAELARARLSPHVSLAYLQYFPVRLFPGRSILVIVSALSHADLETYACLRAAGYKVLLVSPNPVDYAASALPPTRANALAVRLARVERCLDLRHLARLGIQVVDWQVDQSLSEAIRSVVNHSAP